MSSRYSTINKHHYLPHITLQFIFQNLFKNHFNKPFAIASLCGGVMMMRHENDCTLSFSKFNLHGVDSLVRIRYFMPLPKYVGNVTTKKTFSTSRRQEIRAKFVLLMDYLIIDPIARNISIGWGQQLLYGIISWNLILLNGRRTCYISLMLSCVLVIA